MNRSCVDFLIEQLSRILNRPALPLDMKRQIHRLELELRFLKMFFSCLPKLNEADKDRGDVGSVIVNAEATLEAAGQGVYEAGYFAIIGIDVKVWDVLVSNLLEKIKHFKREIRNIPLMSFYGLFQQQPNKSSTNDEILEFIDYILRNLKGLALTSSKADIIIEALDEKLRFCRNFVDFITNRGVKEGWVVALQDFLVLVQNWANDAACLALVCWVDGMDDESSNLPSEMVGKIMPCSPKVMDMHLGLLLASKSPVPSESLLVGKIVAGFVDFLLKNIAVALKDHTVTFRDGLVFFITFLMDPPENCARNAEFLTQIVGIIREAASLIISSQTTSILLLPGLLEKMKKVENEVGQQYGPQKQNSSHSNFPRTNGMRFIDFLMENLEEMIKCTDNFIPFAKHKVVTIHRELKLLRPFLDDINKLQIHDHQELKDLWTQMINVSYLAEHVINSCISTTYVPTWYNMICLSDVIEEIKRIQMEVTMIKEMKKYSMKMPSAGMVSSRVLRAQANVSSTDEVVGFTDDAKKLCDQLRNPSEKLFIVAITGMPGVGKTTLARKVYKDPSIQYNFTKHAWCYVSQVYKRRDLLLDILRGVAAFKNAEIAEMDDGEIADKLRKSLKGHRYLVVMDDVWDIEAWKLLRESLPDNGNRSRILITSRNQNLAGLSKLPWHTHSLVELTVENSLELLKEKVFHKGCCPPELSDIAMKIARNCKGLPLVIVVIAALLERNKDNVDWWKQIELSIETCIDNEGCIDMLELSYNHLPDSLKPCFLYFGAFRQGEVISVRKLIQLWIAEGFIGPGMKSLEVLSKEYMMELIDRSLVIVTETSSQGGIKACRIHDLLYKLCIDKAKEERFLHVAEKSEASHEVKYEEYRLCIHGEWEAFIKSKPTSAHVYSLLLFPTTTGNLSNPTAVTCQFFHGFNLLKVLNLEGINLGYFFPEETVSLIHLRYLAVGLQITSVPSSIANLWNLETLILNGSNDFVQLPDTIWNMKSLKHVDVSRSALISVADYEFDESSQANDIETFSSLCLHHRGDTETLFTRLKRLRKLRCVFSGPQEHGCRKGIQFPVFTSLEVLESLKLLPTHDSDRKPFYNWMRIQFQGFKFPQHLKKLTLYKFRLPWRQLSIIGQLHNLEVLKLREQAFRGNRWEVEEGQFLNVKFLELSNLDVQEWNISSSDSFSFLERLVLGDCYGLVEIPAIFGEILTLKVIKLHRCRYEVECSAMGIREMQKDLGNEELDVSTTHRKIFPNGYRTTTGEEEEQKVKHISILNLTNDNGT